MKLFQSYCGRFGAVIISWLLTTGIVAGENGHVAVVYTKCLHFAAFDSAAAWNNLANSYLERAYEDSTAIDTAIAYYRRAIALASDDAGIVLNMAIAYLMKDDGKNADLLFAHGFKLAGSEEEVYRLLGMKYERSQKEKGTPRSITEAELQNRIKIAADKNKRDRKKPKSVKSKETARPAGKSSKPSRPAGKPSRPGGKKSINPKEIIKYLYYRR